MTIGEVAEAACSNGWAKPKLVAARQQTRASASTSLFVPYLSVELPAVLVRLVFILNYIYGDIQIP